MFGPDDPEALIRTLTDDRTRLVTLTVTGEAYKAEAAPASNNVWAYLVEALARRRRLGLAPFTVLSCDNMPANGDAARTALLRTARDRDELLAKWIARSVSFPHSMVDRITPSPTRDQAAHVLDEFGIRDACSVAAEPFSQWVVEDDFCNDRPPLDAVGVKFVRDVRPYGLMKNRLLNAGHSAIGYLGLLAGHEWTDEVMHDPPIRRYVEELMANETAPLLPHVPGINLIAYQRNLVERFSNPAIRDPLSRLAGRGSTKMPSYLMPSIQEARRRGRPTARLTLAVAGWLRCLRGTDLRGRPLALNDPRCMELQVLARSGGSDPRPLLAKRDIFGDLIDDSAFVDELRGALISLDAYGVRGTLEDRAGMPASCAA
jgi:fructuronate reductase/mannitol 2-dehydrogenase